MDDSVFILAKVKHGLYHRESADKVPALGKGAVRGALYGDGALFVCPGENRGCIPRNALLSLDFKPCDSQFCGTECPQNV